MRLWGDSWEINEAKILIGRRQLLFKSKVRRKSLWKVNEISYY
jgi:hypothetical protein